MAELMTTREVAAYLRIKERKVYELAAARDIPCARLTGKLLFPRQLIDQWVAGGVEGPAPARIEPRPPIVAGSHDTLLEREGIGIDDLALAPEIPKSEIDLGLAILEGKADAGLAIEAVARQLKLDFVALAFERYDLVVGRFDFFEKPLQDLLAFARTQEFARRADEAGGYDVSGVGRVVHNGG